MTTIAYDGRVLAAERGVGHLGCTLTNVSSKIVVGERRMAACVGSLSDGYALAQWWVNGGIGPAPAVTEQDVCLVGVERDNPNALYVAREGRTLMMPTPYAEGSGGHIAFGAMLAGATAVEAVRIACSVESGSRGPIDFVLVDADPWVIRQAPERPAWDGTYTFGVRHEGDGLDEVRLDGRANGGLAPRPQHEGTA